MTEKTIENAIRINNKKNTIEITKGFEKAASRFGSDAYNALREARNDNPNFKVVWSSEEYEEKGLKYRFFEYRRKLVEQ